jgi:deoxyinosine 3'endonuclease (endonuclease V)
LPEVRQVNRRQIYLVDKPGAAQSEIRIGRIGAPRLTEDYYAVVVVNTILGGSFASRLNQNLREDHGYTYGAGSSFDFRSFPGPFRAGAAVQTAVTFGYRTGLLAFREGPAIMKAISRLPLRPDLMVFDGHGIAHPRRFGIACHIGLLTGIASIGCAKTRLIGNYQAPAADRGSFSVLADKGEIVGAVVRTRTNVAPVFVSIGHGIGLSDSIRHVLHCCRKYRLPETTRQADRLAAFSRSIEAVA